MIGLRCQLIYILKPNKPLIRDLIIEGLSLGALEREFNSIIINNDGDVKALFILTEFNREQIGGPARLEPGTNTL